MQNFVKIAGTNYKMNYLITIIGPTAIGKTSLSIALAQHFGCDIISCDSRQFFKEMKIGTAVPSDEELASAPHHFIQNKSIFESYSVGDFEQEALAKAVGMTRDQLAGSLIERQALAAIGEGDETALEAYNRLKEKGLSDDAIAVRLGDEKLAAKMRMLRNHGCEQRYHHDLVGYNMRMSGFQGAALSIKLDYLNGWIEKRQHIAKRYQSEIQCKHIKWQQAQQNSDSVYHLFVITTDQKEALLEHMKVKEVGYAFHYPIPCHLQKAYEFLNHKIGDMPNSEYLASHCVSLPMFPEMTNEEVSAVIDCLNTFL